MKRKMGIVFNSIKFRIADNYGWILLALFLLFVYFKRDAIVSLLLLWQKQNFSPEVDAAIIMAFVTALTVSWTLLITVYFNYKIQRANIRDRIFEKRQNLYNKITHHVDNLGYFLYTYEQKNDFDMLDLIRKEWNALHDLYQSEIFVFSNKVRRGVGIILLFFRHGVLKAKMKDGLAFRELTEKEQTVVFGETINSGKATETLNMHMERYRFIAKRLLSLMSSEMRVKAVENDFRLLQ